MSPLRVLCADLGEWGAGCVLLSEYDAETRTIAVNERAMRRLLATHGAAFAQRFITCAVLHELYHEAEPGASEQSAHAFARVICGDDPRIFEDALREGVA